jgi:3-phenylpropionate/trans-cinnamate dioxygenase ferredoxin reductase subunit
LSPAGPILIVGASLAGLHAARTLREEGYDGPLVVIGEENREPYDRPPLSKGVLLGNVEPGELHLARGDLSAEWLLGERAIALRIRQREVVTARRGAVRFSRLVIATGSRPRRSPGIDYCLPGVAALRTLDDAMRLREHLRDARHVVITGGGFIGVEVASAARTSGCEVTVVSTTPPLAGTGPLVSQACSDLLADHGVRTRIGRRVAHLLGARRLEGVELDDRTTLPADLLVVAVGAKPNVEWLQTSGLMLTDGVACDATLAAGGLPFAVAAGDVARWPNSRFGGQLMRIGHWANAVEQGVAAARNLLRVPSQRTAYSSVPSYWSDHFGTRLQSIGAPQLADHCEVSAGSLTQREFIVTGWRGRHLVSATSYGMGKQLGPFRQALVDRRHDPQDRPGTPGDPAVSPSLT